MVEAYKWRHRFRKHVSRWTLPRESILDLLSRTLKHMSAKEIYNELSAVEKRIKELEGEK
jgi:Fe2+ or Zn2+ uptake regulation protein